MTSAGAPPANGRRAQEVLDYWFGTARLDAAGLTGRMRQWFGRGASADDRAAQDADIVTRFGPLIESAARGELDEWCGSPRRMLALILLLDQFPRHAYRGRAQAFAQDHKAVVLTLDGLATGADGTLSPAERLFFYLPLQHAESMEIQEESITAYRRLVADAPPEQRDFFRNCLDFAEQHRQVVRQFGRFPHRNAALGRTSTPEELQFMEHNAGF